MKVKAHPADAAPQGAHVLEGVVAPFHYVICCEEKDLKIYVVKKRIRQEWI